MSDNRTTIPAPVDAGRAPAAYPRGYRWRRGRNWIILGLTYAAYYLCRYNLGTVTPEMARELHLNNEQTGRLTTGRDFGYMIGTFVNGLFADSLGGKQSMAIGAVATIALNLCFGWFSTVSGLDVAVLLLGLVVIRTVDGYGQAFGSPGMVKINTAWFQRHERGTFAGIFGFMIQLGQAGAIQLSGLLLNGFTLTLLGTALFTLPKQNWRLMFVVPAVVMAVIVVVMWLTVKNYPEHAGFRIAHDDDHAGAGRAGSNQARDAHAGDDPGARLPMGLVFRTIASNPIVWINAGAYMCTGFVRRAYDFWWPKYLDNAWHVGKDAPMFYWLGLILVAAAVVGSFGAGWVSDKLFRARRSPVAALLYGLETLVVLGAFVVLSRPEWSSPMIAAVFLTLISLTCNTSHSIIGTAAVMDIGGRKMAGFALGVINSFQYLGAMMAGWALGSLIDKYHWPALFAAMLPFSILGMLLMLATWYRTRGRDVRGA